jgi:hypothetical protein
MAKETPSVVLYSVFSIHSTHIDRGWFSYRTSCSLMLCAQTIANKALDEIGKGQLVMPELPPRGETT